MALKCHFEFDPGFVIPLVADWFNQMVCSKLQNMCYLFKMTSNGSLFLFSKLMSTTIKQDQMLVLIIL